MHLYPDTTLLPLHRKDDVLTFHNVLFLLVDKLMSELCAELWQVGQMMRMMTSHHQ
jgi:hypothetical protein